jgi:uncharacterized protein
VTTRITVRVKPNARVSALHQQDDGSWVAEVKALPVDGRANEELRALVARRFGVVKARVTIRHGASGRAKLVEIDD